MTQAGIPELRNSNRLISQFFSEADSPRLEVVINRYEDRRSSVSEQDITKALTRPAQWKIPNDFTSVRQMQINATPLVLADSPISRADPADGQVGDRQPSCRAGEEKGLQPIWMMALSRTHVNFWMEGKTWNC